jgi:hypothetical protein
MDVEVFTVSTRALKKIFPIALTALPFFLLFDDLVLVLGWVAPPWKGGSICPYVPFSQKEKRMSVINERNMTEILGND